MVSLAVKYRPKTFEDIKGQENLVKVLKQQIDTGNIKNCYLFVGPSGAGKTTTARVLANAINKGKGFPIEIDAASNSGVENVRTIIDSSNTKSINSEYKIFILDECHSFSNTAWQALLKTLEEPSSKSIFMFCTTEVQKIPATILNRVQRFDIHKIPLNTIVERLRYICEQENFTYEEEALIHIGKLSNGGMRDAISMMEKVSILNNNITLKSSVELLDSVDYKTMFELTNNIFDRKSDLVLSKIDELNNKGKDLKLFLNQYIEFILDINKFIILKNFDYINIPNYYSKDMEYTIKIENSKDFFLSVLKQLIKTKEDTRFESDIKTSLEITLLFLCK